VDSAVAAARSAQKSWASLPAHDRAKHLYAIARSIQKHSRLLAVVESMDNGKPIRESRDADVPLAVRHFYNHAGWAQILPTELPSHTAVGVIAQIIPWNFPFLMLAWKIAPALACGNTVVLKPAPSTRLSAALFCDIIKEAGLPPGVVNIVSGDNDMAGYLANHSGVDKVAFTGSTNVGKLLQRDLAGTNTKLSLELGGKSPVVVYESADQDAAIEGLVNAIWFNGGQVCCAGSRLLVQESIAENFLEKLKLRMKSLRVGNSLDKTVDMSALIDNTQRDRIASFVDGAKEEGADVYQVTECPTDGCYYPPTLITNVDSSSTVVMEEIFGPVLVAQTFRTPNEAVKLANNTRYGLSAGVWTESVGLAMETALSVRAGVVWINCHNLFDAAAGFGGYKESGYGREGGKEGLFEYLKLAWKKTGKKTISSEVKSNTSKWGKPVTASVPGSVSADNSFGGVDRTPKMYIGGSQKRPDGNYVLPIHSHDKKTLLGQVGDGNRKDIRDAVSAANKAQGGWGKRAAYNRSQILFYVAENLSARRAEFAGRLVAMTGCTEAEGLAEVDESVSRLFTYASYADKYGGTVQETAFYGVTSAVNEPVGVIAAVCGDNNPLLQFISVLAPCIARGNSVVVAPSEKYPLAATDLYQIFDTSDLPGGVVNIVTGQSDVLAKTLSEHQHVDGIWYFGDDEGCYNVQLLAASNMKRTFVGSDRDWMSKEQGEGEEFLRESCEVKNIWLPIGESMSGAGAAY
jgi:aldehyde dehydrogenase (NAD+)